MKPIPLRVMISHFAVSSIVAVSRDTAFVIRCEGDDNKPQEFSTWSPKAIAAIGKLGATLRDRAIIISMCRKRRMSR